MSSAPQFFPAVPPQSFQVFETESLVDRLPTPEEEAALLAFFHDPPQSQQPLTPSPMVPPSPGLEKPTLEENLDPLSMTALQHWAEESDGLDGFDALERTWQDRRRFRRIERVMLSAALYVAATLITGAFAFVQLEDSIAATRDAADLEWQTNLTERQAQIDLEEREALATARQALTQSQWTGLLTFIKNSRQHLPRIRDHYREWSYTPFQDPDLRIVDREESSAGLHRVRVSVDGKQSKSNSILLEKVNGRFQLDWESFEDRFQLPETNIASPFKFELPEDALANPYFYQPKN